MQRNIRHTPVAANAASQMVIWMARTWLFAWFADPADPTRLHAMRCLMCACRRAGGMTAAKALDGLMGAFTGQGRRPPEFAAPCSRSLTSDEKQFLIMLSAFQNGAQKSGQSCLAIWLSGDILTDAAAHAEQLATCMAAADLMIPIPTDTKTSLESVHETLHVPAGATVH